MEFSFLASVARQFYELLTSSADGVWPLLRAFGLRDATGNLIEKVRRWKGLVKGCQYMRW